MPPSAFITGVATTQFGQLHGTSWLSLHVDAALLAMEDAGIDAEDIDGIICAYSLAAPHPMMASAFAEAMGIRPKLCFSLQAGGATACIMAMTARDLLGSGCRHILLVTGDNRLTGMSRNGAVEALTKFGHAVFERPYGFSIPAAYALVAQRYMYEHKVSERDLAAVAVAMREHARRHPKAHKRGPLSADDVLASRMIASPLRLLDCCLVSDGAAAVVVSAEASGSDRARPVTIAGAGQAHTHEHVIFASSLTEFGCQLSAQRAFEQAGLHASDVDVAEIYDSFTITLLIELESMGFFGAGRAGAAVADGALRLDGILPCNTHGGLLSFGHSGAAGGMCHLVEAVEQLRGVAGDRQVKSADVAFVHGDGGVLSAHCSLLLRGE